MELATATTMGSPKARTVVALRAFLKKSGLREGDRLPAESKLAAEFAVSRMTLRSALAVLEREGMVRRKHNYGCTYAAPHLVKRGIMARTIVLLSDHAMASDSHLFTGDSTSVVSGVIDRANRHKINFLRTHPDWERDAWIDELIAERPCGVVLSFWNRPIDWQMKLANRLAVGNVPLVVWGEHAAFNGYDRVRSDHLGGAAQLVRTLAAHGKQRILRLWTPPPGTSWIEAHNRGYEQAVTALGLEPIPAVYVEKFLPRDQQSETTFQAQVRQFAGYLVEHLCRENPIDAIMVGTDFEVFIALAACRLFGRQDMAVTGYDNYWQHAPERQWESGIPLATVEKSNHRLGEEMVELLIQRIQNALPAEPQERLLEQQVVVFQPPMVSA